jgi:tetratricopeptide (TPR) repeat protein
MARGKKIVRKKLKQPDEFITVTERAFLLLKEHFRKIALGGIVAVIIVLAVIFFQMWEKSKERQASQKLNVAMGMVQAVSTPYREASPKEYKETLAKLDEVSKEFPQTSSGKVALLYEGNLHLKLGEFEEAVKAYQTFLKSSGEEKLYRQLALEGLAYAFEGKKDYEKAIESYHEIVAMGESFQSREAHFNLGRCYEKMGKKKEALENYRAFLAGTQKSERTDEVLRKIALLEQ